MTCALIAVKEKLSFLLSCVKNLLQERILLRASNKDVILFKNLMHHTCNTLLGNLLGHDTWL